MTSRNADRQLRERLDTYYRGKFEPYEMEGGIPLMELTTDLSQEERLPKATVNRILQSADVDENRRIRYDEFVELVMNRDTEVSRGIRARVMNRAMRLVVPQRVIDRKSYLREYTCLPPPLFIPLITLVEIGMTVYYAVSLGDNVDEGGPYTMISGVPYSSPLCYCPSRRQEAWRFFSYMFVHNGWTHLISNCIYQLLLGIPLEIVHKWWRVGIVYTLGVLAGSLGHSIFEPRLMLVGASGGGYALIGAHFAAIIRNWDEMMEGWNTSIANLICSPVVQLPFYILLASCDTGMALYRYFAQGVTKTGFAAHFAGLAAGVLVGIPVLKDIDVKPWERVLFYVTIIIYLLLMLFAVLWNTLQSVLNPGGYYPAADTTPCCPKCTS